MRSPVDKLVSVTLLAAAGLTGLGPAEAAERYVAELTPLNADVAGQEATGEAIFQITDGRLTITVEADGLDSGIPHLQHDHGFPDGADATCPTAAADANGDGIVDLIETEAVAGTTMVPFHAQPTSLEIPAETYPVASDEGRISYEQTVSTGELEAALQEKFGVEDLALDRRVVFIHGVDPATELPDSVASLGTVPAHITLPVACGEIEAAQR